jgi:hypothetical protein
MGEVRMEVVDSAVLRRECERMYRYLVGGAPREYVIQRYVDGHAARPEWFEPSSALDRTLSSAARRIPLGIVDATSRFASPGSVLRRKLVLLLAILESTPPTCDLFEVPTVSGRTGFYLHMIPKGIVLIGALLLGAVLITPLHLIRRITGG